MSFTDEEIAHLTRVKRYVEIFLYELKPWLREKSNDDFVIAGGIIAQLVQGVHVNEFNDLDVFTLNKLLDQFAPRLVPFAKGKPKPDVAYINKHIEEVFDIPKSNLLFDGNLKDIDVQIIETSYKTRQEVVGGFDYLHCTMHYWNGKLYATPAAYRAAKEKRLIRTAHGKSQDYFSTKRYQKFIDRGYMPIPDDETVNPWRAVAAGIVSGSSPFIWTWDDNTT